jgi:arylsulfatase A-like enzyme/Flp pilus assembly protein TadD
MKSHRKLGVLWYLVRFLLCGSCLTGFLVSCPAGPLPNVVFITVDTTRADRMGFLGSELGLTPNLDQLAEGSVVFTRAYAVVPLTTASHATILTGTYPELDGVNDFGKPLAGGVPYLPEIFHQHGYQTAAFVGSLVLDPIGGTAPGFDRAFNVYDAGFRTRRRGEDRFQTLERRGGEVVAHAIQWLKTRPSGPFFLWVHLYDAHDPYDPPAPYATKFAKAPYNGEIAYEDACIGKLIAALKTAGVYDEAAIALMADHGEALGQHGEETHGIFLYDETIHVPLLFKLPGGGARHRVDARASLVDVAPTVLDVAGLEVPDSMQGKSLKSRMRATDHAGVQSANRQTDAHHDSQTTEQPAYSETEYPHRAFGWSALRSVRAGKYLFIQAPSPELYDQIADPQALKNLVSVSPAVSETLSSQAEEFHNRLGSTGTAVVPPTDAQQAEQLSSLGYVTAGATGSSVGAKVEGVDPKDRIETANLMHDALLQVEDGRYEEAIPRLQRVLAQEPQMAVAQMQLGIAYARSKKPAEALPLLRSSVKRQPDSGMAHYELGLALFDTGDLQGAAPEFEFAMEHAPRWADAHFSLASVYARIDRVPEAMTELTAALELNPAHYRANLLRGRILSLQGHADDALHNLEEAAQVEPRSVEAHLFLADAYGQVGRAPDEARERAAAERLKSEAQP